MCRRLCSGTVATLGIVTSCLRRREPLTCSFSDRQTDEEMLGWIASFAPDEKANLLKEWLTNGKVKVAYLPYDWGQNKKAS